MHAKKSIRRTGAVALSIAMVALLFAPGASAQFSQVISPDKPTVSPDLIFPESGTGTLSVVFDLTLPNTGFTTAQSAEPGINVRATPNCPSYIQITGPTTKLVPYPEGASGTVEDQKFEFDVTIGRNAPGLQAIGCTITLTSDDAAGGQASGTTTGPISFNVKADYYSLVQVKLDKKVAQAGPYKEVLFPLQLSNFGNARTQLAFEVANKPEGGKWDVTIPENIILDSPNTGEGKPNDIATVTVTTTYKTGWNNEKGSFQILIKPTSADQPDKVGNNLNANMLVKVRGVYVPGFEPVVMIGALLGAGLVARMRRDEE